MQSPTFARTGDIAKTMEPSTRKVVTRSPHRTVRLLNLSGLLPAPVEAESSYEAAFVLRAALMPSCKAIQAQPFKIPISPNDYTPDYLQTFSTPQLKPAVIEIKPSSKVKRYSDLFDRAASLLKDRDYEFYVITDRELFRNGIEQRVQLIRRYAKASVPADVLARITYVLNERDCGLPLGSLMRKANVTLEIILHFLAIRALTTGPKLVIDESAVVHLNASAAMDKEVSLGDWFGIAPWGESHQCDLR
jgi:hypothetical protein